MKSLWKPALVVLLLLIATVLWIYKDKIQRLRWATTLFSGAEDASGRVHVFAHQQRGSTRSQWYLVQNGDDWNSTN
ncbi:MAG: hypothetical protein AAF194_10065, partial [Pseudomonadota bacterium]